MSSLGDGCGGYEADVDDSPHPMIISIAVLQKKNFDGKC